MGCALQAEHAAAFSAINAVGDLLADMPDELRCQHEAVWRSTAADIQSLGFSIFKLRVHDAASIRLLRRLLAALVPATEGEREHSLPCKRRLQAWVKVIVQGTCMHGIVQPHMYIHTGSILDRIPASRGSTAPHLALAWLAAH